MSEKNTIVITGASGILGKKIIEKILRETTFNVIGITSKKDELEKTFINNRVSFYERNSIKNADINWSDGNSIVHCAFSRSEDIKELTKSLDFTYEMVKIALDNEIDCFVNISSQSVYEGNEKIHWDEKSEINPITFYGLSKYSAELITMIASKQSKTVFTNLRLSSLVGIGLENRVLSKFIINALKGEPIKVLGGNQVFSYLHVEEAAEAIISLLKVPKENWKTVYNVGSEKIYTLLQIAEAVKSVGKELYDLNVEIEVEDSDIVRFSGMLCQLFEKDTGWRSKLSLADLVEKVFKELKDGGKE